MQKAAALRADQEMDQEAVKWKMWREVTSPDTLHCCIASIHCTVVSVSLHCNCTVVCSASECDVSASTLKVIQKMVSENMNVNMKWKNIKEKCDKESQSRYTVVHPASECGVLVSRLFQFKGYHQMASETLGFKNEYEMRWKVKLGTQLVFVANDVPSGCDFFPWKLKGTFQKLLSGFFP